MKKTLLLLLSLTSCTAVWPQSSCSSDGQPRALALVERFLSADCVECWSTPPTDALPSPVARTLVLDWIVPGAQGDEAPLAAAATRDALLRLEALGQAAPATTLTTQHAVAARADIRVRVAQGLAIADYLGARIELRAPGPKPGQPPWTAWLALVEHIPAGVEGTPIARNIVRNLFQPIWNERRTLSKTERFNYTELRPMRFAEGARPERLRLIGWIADAQGRVLGAAQTVCLRS